MKKSLLLTIAILSICLMGFNTATITDNDCTILHNGTFVYGNPGEEIKVVIKGNRHTEYHQNGEYMIKSKIVWTDECEYNMTITKVTIPNFPYQKGDVMNVQVNSVNGNEIYYTSTVQGVSWEGKFTKVK